jgi:broad specificity phosphatase PhoE
MLILVRHGQSTANRDGLLVGHLDVELTEEGRAQATRLQNALASAERVLSSPLLRARETATLAVPHLTPELDDAFIEMNYGDLDGQLLREVGAATWKNLQDDHEQPVPGGESMADVDRRVHARLDALFVEEAELVASPTRHLVVFSHVSPVKASVAWALAVHGAVAWRIRLDNATMTSITSVAGRPSMVGYNVRP